MNSIDFSCFIMRFILFFLVKYLYMNYRRKVSVPLTLNYAAFQRTASFE